MSEQRDEITLRWNGRAILRLSGWRATAFSYAVFLANALLGYALCWVTH